MHSRDSRRFRLTVRHGNTPPGQLAPGPLAPARREARGARHSSADIGQKSEHASWVWGAGLPCRAARGPASLILVRGRVVARSLRDTGPPFKAPAEPPLRPPLSWKCFSASSLSGRRLVTARAPAENPAAVKALTPRGVAASALMLCGCGAEDFSRSPIGPVVYLTLSMIVCSTRQYFVTL